MTQRPARGKPRVEHELNTHALLITPATAPCAFIKALLRSRGVGEQQDGKNAAAVRGMGPHLHNRPAMLPLLLLVALVGSTAAYPDDWLANYAYGGGSQCFIHPERSYESHGPPQPDTYAPGQQAMHLVCAWHAHRRLAAHGSRRATVSAFLGVVPTVTHAMLSHDPQSHIHHTDGCSGGKRWSEHACLPWCHLQPAGENAIASLNTCQAASLDG